MYFTEGCSSPNSSLEDGESLKISRESLSSVRSLETERSASIWYPRTIQFTLTRQRTTLTVRSMMGSLSLLWSTWFLESCHQRLSKPAAPNQTHLLRRQAGSEDVSLQLFDVLTSNF